MAAYAFLLSGSLVSSPSGAESGDPGPIAPLDEALTLKRQLVDVYDLAADAPQAVAFGGLSQAHVVSIKAVGGKLRARITSADGAQQSIPVDGYLFLRSDTVPITAIDLTRVAGTATTAKVFLGEKA